MTLDNRQDVLGFGIQHLPSSLNSLYAVISSGVDHAVP